jgi:hypothetical protein
MRGPGNFSLLGHTGLGRRVIRERTFKLPTFLPGTESAEFFVLLASDGASKTFKVEDIKFISPVCAARNSRLLPIHWMFFCIRVRLAREFR